MINMEDTSVTIVPIIRDTARYGGGGGLGKCVLGGGGGGDGVGAASRCQVVMVGGMGVEQQMARAEVRVYETV